VITVLHKEKKLDKKDYMLLEILSENSRTPYSRLAKELGLSEAAVRKRIQRLIELGVIKKFTLEYSTGDEVEALILVKVTPPKPVPEAAKQIKKVEDVVKVYEVAGVYDIVVYVKSTGIAGVNRVIDKIRSIDGVNETNTMMILRTWV